MINIKEHMSKDRYKHTKGVMELAKKLAKKHCPELIDKALTAAYYHDIAKEYDNNDFKKYLPKFKEIPTPLRHGMVAAELVREELKINDQDILNAIRYHTIPRDNPSLLEKLIYVSDNNEKGRKIKKQKAIRKLAMRDLDKAFKISLYQTYQNLIKKGRGEVIFSHYAKLQKEGKKIENEIYKK